MSHRYCFMRSVALLTLCAIGPVEMAVAQVVTSNALQRVFQLKHGDQLATGFTLDVDGRQYLITARHVVSNMKEDDKIEIRRDSQWMALAVKVFFPSPASVDIAVLAPPIQISPSLSLPADPVLSVSQDVYFLGFPYGLSMDARNLNAGFPLPFVKKGIVSAFVPAEGGAQIVVVDALNNEGFSGGPLVFRDPQGQIRVAAVVSGYRFQEDRVLDRGRQTELVVRSNTGLLVAYGIKKALEVIAQHPVGAAVRSQD